MVEGWTFLFATEVAFPVSVTLLITVATSCIWRVVAIVALVEALIISRVELLLGVGGLGVVWLLCLIIATSVAACSVCCILDLSGL